MRYHIDRGVALRPEKLAETGRRLKGLGLAGILLALCAGLQACSSDPSWPALGKVTDLSNIMSPEERQKAVQDVQRNDRSQNTGDAAGKPAQ